MEVLQVTPEMCDMLKWQENNEPLAIFCAEEGKAMIQNGMSHIYALFVDKKAAGFFTLSAWNLKQSPNLLNSFFFSEPLVPYPIPVILLGKLYIAPEFRGKTLGNTIMAYAIKIATEASSIIGARFLSVDARPQVIDFYKRFGFCNIDSGKNTDKLLLDIHFISKAIS